MKLQESGENYLETILMLNEENGAVRSIDIARRMDFSKPSISRAMGLLKNAGYILMDQGGAITLTDTGRAIAQKIYERHTVFTEVLIRLGVDEKTASEDACKIEHAISDASFEAIKKHILGEK